MRAMEAGVLGLSLRLSIIKHEKAGLGVFTERAYPKRCTCWLLLWNICLRRYLWQQFYYKTYGRGAISVTNVQFLKYAAKCTHKCTAVDGTNKTVCIVSAPWCVSRYINHFGYLTGDKATTTECANNARTKYFMFV